MLCQWGLGHVVLFVVGCAWGLDAGQLMPSRGKLHSLSERSPLITISRVRTPVGCCHGANWGWGVEWCILGRGGGRLGIGCSPTHSKLHREWSRFITLSRVRRLGLGVMLTIGVFLTCGHHCSYCS
jgi:hypothetical protein